MNIYNYFEKSCNNYPENTSLVVNGERYSYKNLLLLSASISDVVNQLNDESSFVGLMAHRSITAYFGVLGILKSGKGYVPFNPKFPEKRNQTILDLSGINTLILGKEFLDASVSILKDVTRSLNIIIDFNKELLPVDLKNNTNLNFISSFGGKVSNVTFAQKQFRYSYLLFTSGSTGVPKGVPISHKNVCAYVDYMSNRYMVNQHDRFSQSFDLTFDLSVHDMFLCWSAGAALYCIPEKSVIGPAKFIIENALTFWFSVPSVGVFMKRFKMLKPDCFPSLRVSLFCGEPLPASLADAWQLAASDSVVENIYGPTEATIGIMHYRWEKKTTHNKSLNGIVCLGKIFATQECCVVDEKNMVVDVGVEGELLLAGNQLTDAYWNNAEKTNNSFVKLPNDNKVWYKTGDIVVTDKDGDVFYKRRKDFQVQIRGYRVELEEVNHFVATFTKTDTVASIPYPVSDGIAEAIYSFVPNSVVKSREEILEYCRKNLPEYMVPKEIIKLEEFPLNANGKVDMNRLNELIKQNNA